MAFAWSTTHKNAAFALSGSNLVATKSGSTLLSVFGDTALSGVGSFTVTVAGSSGILVGIGTSTASAATFVGAGTDGAAYYNAAGIVYNGAVAIALPSYSAPVAVTVEYNIPGKLIRWLVNGVVVQDWITINDTLLPAYAGVSLDTGGSTATLSFPAASDTTPPTFTSSNSVSVAENAVLAHTLATNETVGLAIRTTAQNAASTDATKFEINGTTLRWVGNGFKDYEAPDDSNTNNTYVVVVRATDLAGNFTDQTITVTVTNVAEVPYAGPVASSTVSSVSSTTNSTTFTPSMSAGSVGRKIAYITSRSNGELSTTSTGWIKESQSVNGTGLSVAVFWKEATGSDALVITSTVSTQYSAICETYPVNTGFWVSSTASFGTGANPTPPAWDMLFTKHFNWKTLIANQGVTVPTVAPAGYSGLTTRAGGGANGASLSIAGKTVTTGHLETPSNFIQASTTYLGLTIGFWTFNAERLGNWRALCRNPTRNPKLLMCGTSLTVGTINNGGAGGYTNTGAFATSRPSVIASTFTALPATAFMIGNNSTGTTASLVNLFNPKFSADSSLATSDFAGQYTLGCGMFSLGTVGHKMHFAYGRAFNRIKVYHYRRPDGAAYKIDVDGGAQTTLTGMVGVAGFTTTTVALTGSASSVINIEGTGPNAGILGIEVWTEGVYQVSVLQAAWFGGTSAQLADFAQPYSPLYAIAAVEPDATVVEIVANDTNGGLTLKQSCDSIRLIFATALISGECMYSMLPYSSTANEAAEFAGGKVMKALADQMGVEYFDTFDKVGWRSHAESNAAGYTNDLDFHKLIPGYASWAGYERAVLDPGPATPARRPPRFARWYH